MKGGARLQPSMALGQGAFNSQAERVRGGWASQLTPAVTQHWEGQLLTDVTQKWLKYQLKQAEHLARSWPFPS